MLVAGVPKGDFSLLFCLGGLQDKVGERRSLGPREGRGGSRAQRSQLGLRGQVLFVKQTLQLRSQEHELSCAAGRPEPAGLGVGVPGLQAGPQGPRLHEGALFTGTLLVFTRDFETVGPAFDSCSAVAQRGGWEPVQRPGLPRRGLGGQPCSRPYPACGGFPKGEPCLLHLEGPGPSQGPPHTPRGWEGRGGSPGKGHSDS